MKQVVLGPFEGWRYFLEHSPTGAYVSVSAYDRNKIDETSMRYLSEYKAMQGCETWIKDSCTIVKIR